MLTLNPSQQVVLLTILEQWHSDVLDRVAIDIFFDAKFGTKPRTLSKFEQQIFDLIDPLLKDK